MNTIEQDPFAAVSARTNAGKALQAWCADVIHRYRLVFVAFGVFYGGVILLVIAMFSGPSL